jgi:hypothetical protein
VGGADGGMESGLLCSRAAASYVFDDRLIIILSQQQQQEQQQQQQAVLRLLCSRAAASYVYIDRLRLLAKQQQHQQHRGSRLPARLAKQQGCICCSVSVLWQHHALLSGQRAAAVVAGGWCPGIIA